MTSRRVAPLSNGYCMMQHFLGIAQAVSAVIVAHSSKLYTRNSYNWTLSGAKTSWQNVKMERLRSESSYISTHSTGPLCSGASKIMSKYCSQL